MIACGGGRLRVHPRDEVMGLIPTFMMKGATSCIATLWSILDLVGAKFTKEFYKSLKCEAEKEGGKKLTETEQVWSIWLRFFKLVSLLWIAMRVCRHTVGQHLFCMVGGCTNLPQ
jgi:hypothetical protein